MRITEDGERDGEQLERPWHLCPGVDCGGLMMMGVVTAFAMSKLQSKKKSIVRCKILRLSTNIE
jgi:hypothetical protein